MSKHVLSSLKQNGFLPATASNQRTSNQDRKSTSSVVSASSCKSSGMSESSLAINDENRKPLTSLRSSTHPNTLSHANSQLKSETIKSSNYSTLKYKGKGFNSIPAVEFQAISTAVRGRTTVEEVNEVYFIFWEYFAKNPRMFVFFFFFQCI